MGLILDPVLWRIDKAWRFHRSVVLSATSSGDRGVWAAIDAGARVMSHDVVMSSFPTDAMVFFPANRWWTAIFMPGSATDLHVDIATPCRFQNNTVRTIDVDLDVVRRHGEIAVLDEDEFESNRRTHAYSDETTAAAQQATIEVLDLIHANEYPFDNSSERQRRAFRST